ncbi:MAG: hypothetical protein MI976_02225 [Pseudomonadales bacterium]|nr:hypothetical protein [Pseudomonadales bacterium]
MKIKQFALTLALTGLASGCAIDPSQCNSMDTNASVITKARCDSTGGYAHNIEKKKLTLAEEQRLNKLFREVYDAVEQERSEVRSELRNKKAEYSKLKTALSQLLAELDSRAEGNKQLKDEIAKIKEDLANMEANKSPVVMQKEAELESLRSRVVELEETFDY